MVQDEKDLSPALENYLAIIFKQEFATGACRPSDIAEAAKVARPSVTNALRSLAKRGYISYEPYSLVNLTQKGLQAGQRLAHRNMVLREFFSTVLQLPEETAADMACKLEHIMPDDVMMRWRLFVLYMRHTMPQWEGWLEKSIVLRDAHAAKKHRVPKGDDTPPAIVNRRDFVDEG